MITYSINQSNHNDMIPKKEISVSLQGELEQEPSSEEIVVHCHNYPSVDTVFPSIQAFTRYRRLFCHMRNATFQSYNNNSTAIYLCPNYKKCGGLLHCFRTKTVARDNEGKLVRDKNGYPKMINLPHVTIKELTSPCACVSPERSTNPKICKSIIRSFPYIKNVSREEFLHIANSYFGIGGKSTCKISDTTRKITCKCLWCKGILCFESNINPDNNPSRYQKYGTITTAEPCSISCWSIDRYLETNTPKTVWFPTPHKPSEMAVTTHQIEIKKIQHKQWIDESQEIAKRLLAAKRKREKPWKFEDYPKPKTVEREKHNNSMISTYEL